jgi:NAD(P)-dependent dehydrogenase (short-subunit alcohol dehydrogenase family)
VHLDTTIVLPKDLESNPKFFGMTQYHKTKLMNLFTVKELARKLKDTDILVCAVHPGLVSTDLVYKNAKGSLFGYFVSKTNALLHFLLARNSEQGAITSAFAVTSDKIISGEYYDSCKIAKSNPQAGESKLAKELWEQSLKLIEINENDIDYN